MPVFVSLARHCMAMDHDRAWKVGNSIPRRWKADSHGPARAGPRWQRITALSAGPLLAVRRCGSEAAMTTIALGVSDQERLTRTATTVQAIQAALLAALTRTRRSIQSTWCLINGGHFKVFYTEPERLALRCVACGHTSPGWSVGSPRLARTMPSNPERLRVGSAAVRLVR